MCGTKLTFSMLKTMKEEYSTMQTGVKTMNKEYSTMQTGVNQNFTLNEISASNVSIYHQSSISKNNRQSLTINLNT